MWAAPVSLSHDITPARAFRKRFEACLAKCKRPGKPGRSVNTHKWVRTASFLFLGLGLLRLLLGRGQALETLEQLLLGHAIDRDLGIVSVGPPARAADQR